MIRNGTSVRRHGWAMGGGFHISPEVKAISENLHDAFQRNNREEIRAVFSRAEQWIKEKPASREDISCYIGMLGWCLRQCTDAELQREFEEQIANWKAKYRFLGDDSA